MEDSKPRRASLRLDEQAWRALLARFDDAALTVKEFCRREELTQSSFFLWRSRLRTDPKRTSGAMTKSLAQATALVPKPAFVDLGVLGAASRDPVVQPAALDLRIELGGGLSLHLVRR